MSTRATVFDEVCDLAEECGCRSATQDRIICTLNWPDSGMAHTACPECGPKMAVLLDEAYGAHDDRPRTVPAAQR